MKNNPIEILQAYFHLMNANGVAQVYRTAIDTGLLDALKEMPLDLASITARCRISENPARLMLEILQSMGLVKLEKGCYELTPISQFLLGSSYRNLGDQYWSHLPTFLRTGKPLFKMDAISESEAQYQAQAAALAWMLAPAAEEAAQLLGIGETERKNLKILDIGAGSAVWSLAMARRDSDTTVTAVDWPSVIRVAEAAARQAQLENRFSAIAGNFHEVDLPAMVFDLAILGNVTHLETPDGNRALLSRVHQALKPRGEVVIFDIFPGQAEGNLNGTLYALGLALRTEHGHVYSVEELDEVLSQAGFTRGKLTLLKTPPYAIGMFLAQRLY